MKWVSSWSTVQFLQGETSREYSGLAVLIVWRCTGSCLHLVLLARPVTRPSLAFWLEGYKRPPWIFSSGLPWNSDPSHRASWHVCGNCSWERRSQTLSDCLGIPWALLKTWPFAILGTCHEHTQSPRAFSSLQGRNPCAATVQPASADVHYRIIYLYQKRINTVFIKRNSWKFANEYVLLCFNIKPNRNVTVKAWIFKSKFLISISQLSVLI